MNQGASHEVGDMQRACTEGQLGPRTRHQLAGRPHGAQAATWRWGWPISAALRPATRPIPPRRALAPPPWPAPPHPPPLAPAPPPRLAPPPG